MSRPLAISVVTPHLRPVGGVVKLLDYCEHLLAGGFFVELIVLNGDGRLPELPVAQRLSQAAEGFRISLGDTQERADAVIFSLPGNVSDAASMFRNQARRPVLIHLVQNVRHANPRWLVGQGRITLSLPLVRICTGSAVAAAVAPWHDQSKPLFDIDLGIDVDFFHAPVRDFMARPLRVGYATWKSELGRDVRRNVPADNLIDWFELSGQTSWADLRSFYHGIDIFLATPNPEEGFYMPGLESAAAGALVICPDVNGNRAWLSPGVNAYTVSWGDVGSYVDVLRQVSATSSPDGLRDVAQRGQETANQFRLEREREAVLVAITEVIADT